MHLTDYLLDKYQQYRWRKDSFFAVAAGLSTLFIIIGGAAAVQVASRGKALALLESTFPTTRFMAMGVMTASATILALMVTILSLSTQSKRQVSHIGMRRIRQIAFFDMLAFVLAVIFLSLHTLPVAEFEFADPGRLSLVYFGVLTMAGILGGLLVGVMSLLYFAVRELIRMVT